MRFMFYADALNVDRFSTLRRLVKDTGQRVFQIVDDLRVYPADQVKVWAVVHSYEIELFYPPTYRPDHNIDKSWNNSLKQDLRQPATQDKLIINSRFDLRTIQRLPRLILSYYKSPAVRYQPEY